MPSINKIVTLSKVRVSFPSLFEREVFEGKPAKFGVTFLLDRKTHSGVIKEVSLIIKTIIDTEFKNKPKPYNIPIKNGDESKYDGYAGCISLRATNNKAFAIVDNKAQPILKENDPFYSGCYVNAKISPWYAYSYKGTIAFNLLGIQFCGHGEHLQDSVRCNASDFDTFECEGYEPFDTSENTSFNHIKTEGYDYEEDPLLNELTGTTNYDMKELTF